MTRLRLIDALQRPDVLDGTKWMALPLPSVGGWTPPAGFILPTQTLGVDVERKRLYWCDGTYAPRAIRPSHFGGEAALTLPQLLGECTLVDAPEEGSPNKP